MGNPSNALLWTLLYICGTLCEGHRAFPAHCQTSHLLIFIQSGYRIYLAKKIWSKIAILQEFNKNVFYNCKIAIFTRISQKL